MSDNALQMTPERIAGFLEEMPMCALSSLRKSGGPIVVPVGFAHRDGALFVSIREGRAGTARMRKDSRVCATIFDHAYPPSWVVVEGRAKEVEDPGFVYHRAISERFITKQGLAMDYETWLKTWTAGRGRILFRISMDRVLSFDGRAATEKGWGQADLARSHAAILNEHTGWEEAEKK